MNRWPLLSTALVLFFLIGVPVILIQRLLDGVLPTQAYDVVLAVALVAWILVSKAILDRDQPVAKLIENRLSPRWQAQRLVEHSLLGVGLISTNKTRDTATDARLFQLYSPRTVIDSVLPPPVVAGSHSGRARFDLDEDGRPRLQPTFRLDDPEGLPIVATEEYTVSRTDTFWSIAEQRLGDGRRWKSLEQLNAGREVAPGIYFTPGETIRIGWSVLVPIDDTEEDAA